MKLDQKINNLAAKELELSSLGECTFFETEFSYFWDFKKTSWLLKKPKIKENKNEGYNTLVISRQTSNLAVNVKLLEDGYYLLERLRPLDTFSGKDIKSLKEFVKNYSYSQKVYDSARTHLSKFPEIDYEEIYNLLTGENSNQELKVLIQKIYDKGVQTTFEHGDLHLGNLMKDSQGHIKAIDWSECSLAHPFLSMTHLEFAMRGNIDNGIIEEIVEIYLDEWSEKEIYKDVKKLSLLHFAYRYHLCSMQSSGLTSSVFKQDSKFLLTQFMNKLNILKSIHL